MQYTIDPEGSVSVIEPRGRRGWRVSEVSFGGIDRGRPRRRAHLGSRKGTTIAQDLEPEYICIDKKGQPRLRGMPGEQRHRGRWTSHRKKVVKVFGLGSKNHAELGNALDASDKDNMIRVANWRVKGLYMPDAIACYRVDESETLHRHRQRRRRPRVRIRERNGRRRDLVHRRVTARGSRARPQSAFPLGDTLKHGGEPRPPQHRHDRGRRANGDGKYEELFSFGARSFSIFSSDGELLYRQRRLYRESTLRRTSPECFNFDNDENDSFDSRSDAKGPEPEALALGTLNHRTYAFLGLERVGGIMVFDITESAPT